WTEPDLWIRDTPSVVAAFIVCIPAIYFNRRLWKEKEHGSILDIGVATVFSTASIAAYLVYSFPPNELAGFAPAFDWELLNFASVVLLLLVLLPVFAKEASRLGAERSIESTTKSKLGEGRLFRRLGASTTYSILGYALGLATCLIPITLFVNVWMPDDYVYDTISVMVSMEHRYFQEPFGWTFLETRIRIPELMPLVDLLVFTGLRTLFGYNVVRYCRGRASRRRTLSYGIAGVLVPLIYFQIMRNQYAFADITYVIPLPIVFILGYMIIRVVEPVEPKPEAEAIQDEEMVLLERERKDAYEEDVRVPILYSIRSRMRGVMSRLKDSQRSGGPPACDTDQTLDESAESEVRDSE
ncbi:MAG: hypothetical protein ACFFB7_06715, partial [Candidatus Sifarchaeia archaeon]